MHSIDPFSEWLHPLSYASCSPLGSAVEDSLFVVEAVVLYYISRRLCPPIPNMQCVHTLPFCQSWYSPFESMLWPLYSLIITSCWKQHRFITVMVQGWKANHCRRDWPIIVSLSADAIQSYCALHLVFSNSYVWKSLKMSKLQPFLHFVFIYFIIFSIDTFTETSIVK